MVSSLDLVDKSKCIWCFLSSLYGKKPSLDEAVNACFPQSVRCVQWRQTVCLVFQKWMKLNSSSKVLWRFSNSIDFWCLHAASSKHSYAFSWKSTHGNNFSCFYLCREVLKLDLFFFLSSEDVVKRILVIAAWLAIHTVCFFSLCSFIGKENTYVQKKVQLILPYWRDCMVWIKSSQSLFLL